MPVSVSWLVLNAIPPPVPPTGLPPATGSFTKCVIEPYSKDSLQRIIDRSYPESYIEPMKVYPNSGYEIFVASACVFEAISATVSALYCGMLIGSAEGGLRSVGSVEFFRPVATFGALTIAAGSIVTTSRTGRSYIVLEDVVFGAPDLGPITVQVIAEAVGAEYNVQGQLITGGGEVLPGEIDTITKLQGTEPAIDPEVQVRQIVPTSGGRAAYLDALGDDLIIPRQNLEPDDAYRARILETPDTVSPSAIQRGLDKLFLALGVQGCLREVGTSKFPGFFYDAGSSGDSPQNPVNNYAYDMDFTLRPEDRFKLLLDQASFRGYFLVGVPSLPGTSGGFLYDGSTSDAFQPKNAYDTIGLTEVNANYDGSSLVDATVYKTIYAMVNDKRAFGVGFDLYIENTSCT